MPKTFMTFVPGLLGAALGGYLGSMVVYWVRQQGFYAPVIPGALAGLLCGYLSIDPSRIRGVLCGLIALASCLLTEWTYFLPPVETDGFLNFLAHFHQQPPLTLIMIGLGTFFGFWWGREATNPWRGRLAPETGPGSTPH